MPPLSVYYYRSEGGDEPVDDFAEALEGRERQAVFDVQVGHLRDLTTQNPRLTEPYSQPVDEELWALHVSIYEGDNAERYRVVYAIYDLYCVVLHSYPLVGAAADAEHAIARSRWEDFLRRIDGDGLSPLGSPIP